MNTIKDDLYIGLVNYIDYEKKKSKIKLRDIQDVINSVADHFNIRIQNDTDNS